MAGWNPLDDPIDYFVLAGKPSPGLADIAGAGTPRKWEERAGYGITGSTLFYLGNGLAKFDATILLATTDDWDAWNEWKPIVKRAPDARYPKALDIWHPFLEELEIKQVVVVDSYQPERVGDDGLWAVKIDFMQHKKRKLALVQAEGSQATPKDPVDQYIDDLTGQLEALL